jgi:hypothetical protein
MVILTVLVFAIFSTTHSVQADTQTMMYMPDNLTGNPASMNLPPLSSKIVETRASGLPPTSTAYGLDYHPATDLFPTGDNTSDGLYRLYHFNMSTTATTLAVIALGGMFIASRLRRRK